MSFTIFYIEKTPLYPIKTRSSKSRKIDIFPKMSFTIFYIEKTPLQPIKTRSSKSRKVDIFPKGLTHGFCLKMAVYPAFIFQAIQARKNFFYDILEQKTPQQAIKTRSSKSQKIGIFPKGLTHAFGLKMAVFPCFFFRQYRPGKCLSRYSTSKKRLCRL